MDAEQRGDLERGRKRLGLLLILPFILGSAVVGVVLAMTSRHRVPYTLWLPLALGLWVFAALVAVVGVWLRTRGVQRLRERS